MKRLLELRHSRANGLKAGCVDYGQLGRAAGVVCRLKEVVNRLLQVIIDKVVGSPTRTGIEDQVVDGLDLIVFDEDGAAVIAVLTFPGDFTLQHISARCQIVFDQKPEPHPKSVTTLVLFGKDELSVF